MAINDSSHVVGLHLAGCGGAPPAAVQNAPAGSASTALRTNRAVDADHNLGYQEVQSTKPQTVGQGLSDSPVALASWIVEKWYGWSDHNGDLEKIFTKDELLTNIMLYWVTNSGASSARIYYENRHVNGELAQARFPPVAGRVTVPTGCGAFPSQYDRRSAPLNTNSAEVRAAAEARYNLVHFTTMPHGGHFPAFEQPKLWVDDIRAFYRDRR
jgi:pimeloyl-ACP methyl ester carboxylesterase